MEPKITFSQVEPTLHKWGYHFSSVFEGAFEPWELINAAWADGKVRFLPQSKLKWASHRIRWDMIDYIRIESKSRCRVRWDKSGRPWPFFYHISSLEDTDIEHRPFIETYAAPSEDLEQKDLISFLVNHPALSGRERLLMKLHYVEGYTLREVGRIIGCTQSRISQLRKNILERLRAIALSKAV